MTLFDEGDAPATIRERVRRSPPGRGVRVGAWSLAVASAILLVLSFLPTTSVIQRPGPVFDTLGTSTNAEGTEVPLIEVEGAPTYPTTGTLDLTTVQVVGDRARTPSWFEIATAWFDPSKAVVPIDAIFPSGQTTEQRTAESAAMMVDSQLEATAAALRHLDYDVVPVAEVASVVEGSAAQGRLREGDEIVSVDGTATSGAADVRAAVNAGGGAALTLVVDRADAPERTETVTPTRAEDADEWRMGVSLLQGYDFPIDVKIQLDNVGGPSAGMMFALGIVDTLTPGDLAGGARVAGTGTITGDGAVGPIGGIRQKLYGARGAGAEIFLAPAKNCDEVVGHVPDGLRVFSVATLDDSIRALDAVRTGGDLDALPACTS